MKNRIFQYSGYILFGALLFLLFIYIKFPYLKLKDKLTNSFENRFLYALTIKDVRPLFPLGLTLKEIEIFTDPKEKKITILNAQKIDLKLEIIAIFIGNRNIFYEINAYNGIIRGAVKNLESKKDKKTSINADIQNIDLTRYSLLNRDVNLSLSGKLRGKVNIFARENTTPGFSGNITLFVDNGKIEGINIKRVRLKEISLKGVDCDFELTQQEVFLKKMAFHGEDIDVVMTGKILLAEQIKESNLDLMLHFKPKQGFMRKYSFLFTLFRNIRGKGGFYSIPLKGTIQRPEFETLRI
ncbi:MAG: type II secretion system protein GspN [Thermodesulfobacteriota bacterium]|nr:type II secretion system protein GspN [Thermodesulfobacteriota bacterium]